MNTKFKLMWENNPDTPISAAKLSETINSSSELGGILYKDIAELLPNGQGNFSDDFLKLRANSRVLLKNYNTQAMLFNSPKTLTSHNSKFGPVIKDNVVFLNESKDGVDSIYAGEGTENLFQNPGFEEDWYPWTHSYSPAPGEPEYDSTYGEEYQAIVEIVDEGFESGHSARMYTGLAGKTEISRTFDLTGMALFSMSFYYKSNGGLRFYIVSGGSYWKDNDWNQYPVVYELPETDGKWERFEVKNIPTQVIINTIDNVGIYIYSNTVETESFIDSFQLEELPFSSPYIDGIRQDASLAYPPAMVRADKGYVDLSIYPKDVKDFTLFSLSTTLGENAVELIYVESLDQFQIRVMDTNTNSYISLGITAGLAERVDSWTRIICGWDQDLGLKIITDSSPNIESIGTAFEPHTADRVSNFYISSDVDGNLGSFFIDTMKINIDLKDDGEMMKDYERVYSIIDDDVCKIFYVGEEAVILNESFLDIGDTYDPLTYYYIWVIDDDNGGTASLKISKSSLNPDGIDLQIITVLGGFRTDENSAPMQSSLWDITTEDDRRIHAQRLHIKGKDSDIYNFDVRTKPYAEEDDIRSTIPIHFSDNLYGRHTNDLVIRPEVGTHDVEYFEVNTEGWMALDNLLLDASKIQTRNYPDALGVYNNNLILTTYDYEEQYNILNVLDNTPIDTEQKIWIRAHEVDIDSGNRDIKLDSLRIDEQYFYTKADTDMMIDVTKLDGTNDLYLKANNIYFESFNDFSFTTPGDFIVSAKNITMTTNMGIFSFDDIHIDDYNIYNDTGDVHIYSTDTVDIDSGTTGQIELDDIHIKDNLIHRDAGDILIETPNSIILGKTGNPDIEDPYTTDVIVRSDNFIVESQTVSFTNVDASDFIRFDDIKIRQSEIYTEAGTPLSVNGAGTLALWSGGNVTVETPNIIEFKESGGNFISRVNSTFTKDLNVLNVNFTDVDASDSAQIFTVNNAGSSTLHVRVADDTEDKIILEHGTNNTLEISDQGIRISGNLIIDGTQTSVNSTNTEISDNTFVINKSADAPISQDSAFEVERVGNNSKLYWSETDNYWQVDMGDGVLHNIIFNGYDERFAENVNVVTTDPAGFKLENDHAVGGMELLDPDNYGTSLGEGIMNMGLHMNYSGGYIGDKSTAGTASVGAFIKLDTRVAQKSISFVFEEADDNVEKKLGEFDLTGESTAQSLSPQTNLGTFKTPWIRTNAIETSGEGAAAGTGIFLGSGAVTPGGYAVSDDEIILSTSGQNSIKVANNAVSFNESGNFYTGTANATGDIRLNYDGYFHATRVYNAVYNDLAEYFLAQDKPQAGKVYKFNDEGKLVFSNKRADSAVAGVCSDTPAFVMKQEYENKGGVAIALAGSVEVWVKDKIMVGDELVSDVNGFASRAKWYDKLFNRSSIIGKAIKPNLSGENRILMFVKNV